ncbi:hypothetical protein O3M35_007223 [Rhynocoris fuscipes]|uniref:Uncharacterized protein n=1 Tax=Rhynocoris fuscipes TaxID=488301 RepID=A0AAW1DA75_9HEMI
MCISIKRDGREREGLVGPEPFCGVSKSQIRGAILKWTKVKSHALWTSTQGLRQSKFFIKGRSARFTADLLSQDRRTVRMLIELLASHCRLNKHMSNMRLADDDQYRFCLENDET